ncbi:hypothetical protein EYF80_045498 [Liparis tanakae]|uniref:Uncharacterized protein n=1 Tax=Liparis tanakae TaxID=230148 RepID=A0A4Z2FT08_9TELE|nr:hypothetical protein EYF80_045498 [Liparis tanakae]
MSSVTLRWYVMSRASFTVSSYKVLQVSYKVLQVSYKVLQVSSKVLQVSSYKVLQETKHRKPFEETFDVATGRGFDSRRVVTSLVISLTW